MIIKLYNTQNQEAPVPNGQSYGSPRCDIIEGARHIRYEILQSVVKITDDIESVTDKKIVIEYDKDDIREVSAANLRAVICTDEGKTVEVINL